MLFRVEFHEEGEMSGQLGMMDDEVENIKDEDVAYINNKCNDIIAKISEIDEWVNNGQAED